MLIIGWYLCLIMAGMNTGVAVYWRFPPAMVVTGAFLVIGIVFRNWEVIGE